MTKLETISENTEKLQTPMPGRVRDSKGRMVFAPGVSGNPAGKPKGSKHLTTKLFEALENMTKDGKSYSDLLVQRILNDAIVKGNTSMIHMIMNYVDGMPQQGIDVTSNGDSVGTSSIDVLEIAKRVSDDLKIKKTKKE